MKTTAVPAQVTTVEDKVAGNLSFTQLLLLITPVFVDSALFVVFPPLFKLTVAKLIIGVVIAVTCALMAIRIKGKLILNWIMVLARFNSRPRYYLFNKNDGYLRKKLDGATALENTNVIKATQPKLKTKRHLIPTQQMVQLETALADPRAKFHLKATKGGLRVYIREIKEESI